MSLSYSFTVSDHLGNTRVVVDEQGQVQQKNEYGEERREMLRQAQQPGKREEKRKFCSNRYQLPRLRRADVPSGIR